MSYPIQPGKVQAPALRDETLARTRLLDWIDAKIHSRVIFVIADAGYGKTTLLADFSRRTRLRTIWYRLDEDDRDWVGFLSHLVAAGREHDPDFAPRTAHILRTLEPGGPTRDDAVAAFLEELPSLTREGAALIFDDFHLADEVADVREIVREIVARAPERLSIVFASRRQPAVPVSRLRAIGELAELGISDLRFSDAELEQLFRETYGRPLEPDVLSELAKRTEGWAASLTLIQAALRERTSAETRSFVRGLSGARDELHDYLAEEVVGDLPQIHQQFLMRTSVLQVVTPELAQIATGLAAVEVQSLMLESERLGLLGRRSNRRSTAQRYHPLVREFLEERLRREIGPAGVDDLHVTVARWAESTDWRTSAHHFAAAKHWRDLQNVLEANVETIVASGASVAALELIDAMPDSNSSIVAHVFRSRVAAIEGDYARGLALARRAAELAPESDVAVGTLVSALMLKGEFSQAALLLDRFAGLAKSPLMRDVAAATRALLESSTTRQLRGVSAECQELAEKCRALGLAQFEGTSWLNAGHVERAIGSLRKSLVLTRQAIDAFGVAPAGPELSSARFLEASLLGMLGDVAGARIAFRALAEAARGNARAECLIEFAEMEALVGSAEVAADALGQLVAAEVGAAGAPRDAVEAILVLRANDHARAAALLEALPTDRATANPGYRAAALAFRALALVLANDPRAKEYASISHKEAVRVGAGAAEVVSALALSDGSAGLSSTVASVPRDLRYALSFAAELVAARLGQLDDGAIDVVRQVASEFPQRWRPPLRRQLVGGLAAMPAARILDVMGDGTDVKPLRRLAKDGKKSGDDAGLGRRLARSLATRVSIHDLGRVVIQIGQREMTSSHVRRKVLSLLCFLLTRPRWAATREEVMDAMWPEIDPTAAINSLNQSVYFLRRVFEPEYSEETTAGYVHQDSDLLWLDPDLISATSRTCASLIAEYEKERDPAVAVDLSDRYLGKFALDFAYDEWSVDFREWLHVAWLHALETQIRSDIDHGRFDRGILLARRALEIEPRNEELELSMLKLLRRAGAHSAAAEQYEHYSNLLRADIGVEPPPLDAV